jgi:hypothetical protein
VLYVVLLLCLSGCAGSSSSGDSSSTQTAELTVEHVLDQSTGILYIEGSVWHLRVLDAKGVQVLDRQLRGKEATATLAPGQYRLESEEFPCSGNCAHLDPGTDGCSTEFEAEPGVRIAATVTLKPTQGCEIEFAPEPAT